MPLDCVTHPPSLKQCNAENKITLNDPSFPTLTSTDDFHYISNRNLSDHYYTEAYLFMLYIQNEKEKKNLEFMFKSQVRMGLGSNKPIIR